VFSIDVEADGAVVVPSDPSVPVPREHNSNGTTAWHGLRVKCTADFEYGEAVAAGARGLYDGDIMAFTWDGVRALQAIRGGGTVLPAGPVDGNDLRVSEAGVRALNELAERRLGRSPGCIVLTRRRIGAGAGAAGAGTGNTKEGGLGSDVMS